MTNKKCTPASATLTPDVPDVPDKPAALATQGARRATADRHTHTHTRTRAHRRDEQPHE